MVTYGHHLKSAPCNTFESSQPCRCLVFSFLSQDVDSPLFMFQTWCLDPDCQVLVLVGVPHALLSRVSIPPSWWLVNYPSCTTPIKWIQVNCHIVCVPVLLSQVKVRRFTYFWVILQHSVGSKMNKPNQHTHRHTNGIKWAFAIYCKQCGAWCTNASSWSNPIVEFKEGLIQYDFVNWNFLPGNRLKRTFHNRTSLLSAMISCNDFFITFG